MHNPLDPRFVKTQELMKSGVMVGRDRPIGRVTWSKPTLKTVSSTKAGLGDLRYLDKTVTEHEILTVRTIEIDRSIGQDAATATISVSNVNPTTTQPEGIDTGGTTGYLTMGRGETLPEFPSVYSSIDDFYSDTTSTDTYPTSWGYPTNDYRDVFIPNTVLRTYQGYGSDNLDDTGNPYAPGQDGYVAPQDDTQLYMTGVWLIDRVTYNAVGAMNIECRDLAKLLIEQYIYPPMIPIDRFPLFYCPAHAATGHKESIGKNVASFHSSSVDQRYGRNAAVLGRRGTDAFDGKPGSFWLSEKNAVNTGYAWLQARVKGPVNEVILETWSGNYVVYVSVHEKGKWQGSQTMSGLTGVTENLSESEGNGSDGFIYVISSGDTLWDLAGRYYGNNFLWPRIAAINSNIIRDPHWIYPGQRIKIPYITGTKLPPPARKTGQTGGTKEAIKYVLRATIPKSGKITIKLPRTYSADYLRVSLTQLSRRATSDYRAGIRTMIARNHISNTYVPSTIGKAGYIQDWCVDAQTEILTQSGWLSHAQVNEGDLAYSINPATGSAEWSPVIAVYRRYDARHQMIQLKNAGHDSLTTPNHRWLTRAGDTGEFRWRTTETLNTNDRVPVAVRRGDWPDSPAYADELVELVGWYVTEGSTEEISRSWAKNAENCARIEKCLTVLYGPPGYAKDGGMWHEHRRGNIATFKVRRAIHRQLDGLAPRRVLSMDFLLALTERQMQLLVDTIIDGDGWRTAKNRTGIVQHDEARIRSFETAVVLSGAAFSTREDTGRGHSQSPKWVTTVRTSKQIAPALTANPTSVEYDGVIWCPKTMHSNWLARRNGEVYFTGNTEPVKEMCAWGGLTWPNAIPNPPDPVLGSRKGDNAPLRVWGDFETLGAGPVVCTPGDYFTSKSFAEGIRQIVDFIGGIFYIDETGGAQFRLPNIWNLGNFINDTAAASSLGARIHQVPVEFHEDANLVSYQMVVSDAALRSEILVIGGYPNVHGSSPVAGGYVLGYNPVTHTTSAIDFSNVLAGQYRLMVLPGDATNLFYTEIECQRMAELTALFILFTYRQGTLSAPAHPGLQIDDQVRIVERVTSEQNVHYVSGLRTNQDLETGEYTMEVTTHWLGTDPDRTWFVNKAQLTPAVKQLPAILARIGMQAGGDVFEQPPYGVS